MTHRASLLGRGYQDDHLDSPRLRFRRALTLCAMTVVAPGSAQVVVGRRWVGVLALLGWVGLLVAGGVFAWRSGQDRVTALNAVTDAQTLLQLRIGLAVVVIIWLALFVDAWRLAQPFSLTVWRGSVVMVINTVLVVAVAGSGLFASQLLQVQRDVVKTVFNATRTSAPLEGRYNILLLGSDSGKDRTGIRPDSLTVASIDADTGRTVIVSLPRNLQNVPFPEDSPMHQLYPYGYNCGSECLINAVHTAAENRTDLYPNSADPGLDATIDAVEGATDLHINYYVMVNLKGFSSLVDAVGGVEMDVKTRIAKFGHEDAYKQKYIEPGQQRLDGPNALWYARSRVQSDDYTRMGRQKCLMSAMLQQLSPQKVVLNAKDIAESGKELLSTNLPAQELGQFADLAIRARGEKIRTVSIVPPAIDVVSPDFDLVHRLIAEGIEKSERGSSPSASADVDGDETSSPTDRPDSDTATPNLSQSSANTTDDLASSC